MVVGAPWWRILGCRGHLSLGYLIRRILYIGPNTLSVDVKYLGNGKIMVKCKIEKGDVPKTALEKVAADASGEKFSES